ncbi:uncharacterized protein LOC119723835 [Patiria miniata]|uniref:PDZ domain-containing protein n=1 Tax=Patiria miniata TaxID=46514 RepID=A0A913ZFS2_PATMI|nr:uncharacterized protein LOC119723835 [Patiria miniata]
MSKVSEKFEFTQDPQECHRLYMKYPGVNGAYCELECCVDQRLDTLDVERVATGRLAYDIGLRNGDILRSINLTKVERVSVSSIVETMQWLDVDRPIVIGIERKRQQQVEFWWFVFKLENKGGYPVVDVIFSISNDCGEIPEFQQDFQTVSTFMYQPPPIKINIVQATSQLYLSVQSGKLEFLTFNPSTAQFYMYRYGGSNPARGVPVALVQMPLQDGESDSCIETVSLDEVQLSLTDFPPFMTSSQPILSNSRFFYHRQDGDGFSSFESESESGYYIAKDPESADAIAEKPPTSCSAMHVHSDGPAIKL